MSAAARIATFAGVLALVFAGAVALGGAIDPDEADDTAVSHGGDSHGETEAGHGEDRDAGAAAHPVRGLAAAENGLRLVVDRPELQRGSTEQLSFRIVVDSGAAVTDFDVEHEKRMHLIVVRRDLTGFQHLHPAMAADGTWSTDIRLDEAGSYRLFADFSRDEEPNTLATDLRVDGAAQLVDLPAPASAATSEGGYEVDLDTVGVEPGRPSELQFTVTRNGMPADVEPYLGATGHLVALREGDLAFLHVHPSDHAEEQGADAHADPIAFEATFPTEGRYRLFLQFKVDGRVETAAFTLEVK